MKEIFAETMIEEEIQEISYDFNIIGKEQLKNNILNIKLNIKENKKIIEEIEMKLQNNKNIIYDEEYFDYIKTYIKYFKEMLFEIGLATVGSDTISFPSSDNKQSCELWVKLNKYYNKIFNRINVIINNQKNNVDTLNIKLKSIANNKKLYLNELYQLRNYYMDSMRNIIEQLQFDKSVLSLK